MSDEGGKRLERVGVRSARAQRPPAREMWMIKTVAMKSKVQIQRGKAATF